MTDHETLYAYRINQAEETLKDAKIIHEEGGTRRSVVNRAYYAVFYSVLSLFLKSEISLRTSKHSGIIGIFDKEFIISKKIDKSYSRILHLLFDERQEFDYKENADISREEAEEAIKNAEKFISFVKSLL